MVGSRRLLAAGFLLLFVALSGCSITTVQEPVCFTCERGVETVEGANVTVDASALRIELRPDGSGRWTVTSDLSGPGVDRLRSNETAVQRLADRAVTARSAGYRSIHGGNVSNRTAEFENGTLAIAFTVEDASRQTVGGTLLFDYLHTKGRDVSNGIRAESGRRLGADEVVVAGPTGTVVSNDPPGGRITDDGRSVVWTDRDTQVDYQTYVAFGPRDSVVGRPLAEIGIASDVLRWAAPSIVATGYGFAVGLAVLFGVLWVVLYNRSRIAAPAYVAWYYDLDDAYPAGLVEVGIGVGFVVVAVVVALGVDADPEQGIRPLVALAGVVGACLLAGRTATRSPRTSAVLTTLVVGTPFVVAAIYVPVHYGTATVVAVAIWTAGCVLASPALLVGWYTARGG